MSWQPEIVRDLHDARLTGNWSLHDFLEFTPEEIEDLADLIREAVQVLYVEPAERRRLRDSRAAKRQKSP
jgi:hypothetical protein